MVEKDTERHWLERALTHTTRQIEKMVVFSPRQSRGNPNTHHSGSAGHPPSPTTGLMGLQPPSNTPHMDCPSAHPAEGSEGRGFPPDTTRTIEDTPVLMCCRENLAAPHAHHDVDFHETMPLPGIPPRKYLEKMVLELSGEQAAIVHDAFRKARKESGLSDRASLVTYMARAFMDGVRESRDRHSTKPAYQVVLHHQSGVSWVESERGSVYVADTMCEKALCDAEIVEVEAAPDDCRHDCAECDKETQSPGEEQISGEGLVCSILRSASGQARDIESECVSPGESVNRLFQLYREKAREGSESGTEKQRTKSTPVKSSNRTIPLSLRKKVLFRDGGRCQAPGCGRNRFVEIHHVLPVGAGGTHSLPNVLVLCGSCHALVHEGRLSIEGEAPGRLRWRRVQG